MKYCVYSIISLFYLGCSGGSQTGVSNTNLSTDITHTQEDLNGPSPKEIEDFFERIGGLHLLDAPLGTCDSNSALYRVAISYEKEQFKAVRSPVEVYQTARGIRRLACITTANSDVAVVLCEGWDKRKPSMCWAPNFQQSHTGYGQFSVEGEVEALFQYSTSKANLLYVSARDGNGKPTFQSVNLSSVPWGLRPLLQSQFKALKSRINSQDSRFPWLSQIRGLECPVDVRIAEAPPTSTPQHNQVIRLGGQGCPPGPSQSLNIAYKGTVCAVASCNVSGRGVIYYAVGL